MRSPGRRSDRLKGFDYSEPGGYFVTMCTKNRECIFGDVLEGNMRLSEVGKIVERCWNAIPDHFQNVCVDTHQVMPNHVHGIVEIREEQKPGTRHINFRRDVACNVLAIPPSTRPRRGVQSNAPTEESFSGISPRKGTLGVIVRTFKGAVTTALRRKCQQHTISISQRNYHDRIIRSDIEYYFVQMYIEMNPLLWSLHSDNPEVHGILMDELRYVLKEKHGLDEYAIRYFIDDKMMR